MSNLEALKNAAAEAGLVYSKLLVEYGAAPIGSPEDDAIEAAHDEFQKCFNAYNAAVALEKEIANWTGFVCYNRAEVDAAYAAKEPRSVEAIYAERYPNCTVDR